MDLAGSPRRVAERAPHAERTLVLHGCTVDLAAGRLVTDAGEVRGLTRLETRLLGHLAARAGQDVARDELLREVWQATASTRAVDFTVRRLRDKLGEPTPPRHVLTAHGVGYRFVGRDVPERCAPSHAATANATLRLATGEVDLDRRTFHPVDGPPVPLTATEGAVLAALAGHAGTLVGRERLIREVWGPSHRGRSLEATLSRLRDKIDPHRVGVLTSHRGAGVRLERAGPVRAGPEGDPGWVDRDEQDLVAGAVGPGRWVTLVGAPGAGKTALARRVVGQAPSGLWVALDRAEGEAALVAAVAAALHAAVPEVEPRLAALPPGTVVGLDNLEQLLDDAAVRPRLGAWAVEAPQVAFLATSRAAVGLPGERLVAVGGLSASAGARLFRLRAGLDPDGPPDPVAVALSVRLEGNPFALELAAARARREPASALLERPDEDLLDLLVRRPPGATSQHSTLRAAFDPAWDRLDAETRAVLVGCAPIRGPLDPALVRAATDRPRAGDALETLAGQSLLVRDEGGFRWVGPVRSYAAERLARTSDAAATRDGCAAAVLDAVEHALHTRHAGLAHAGAQLWARAQDLEPLCRAEAPDVRARAAVATATWALHVGQPDRAHAAARAALDRGVPRPYEAALFAALASSGPAADRARWIACGRTAARDGDDIVHVELARAELAEHRDALRFSEAVAAARSLAQDPRVQRVPPSSRGRVWLDLAGVLVLSAQPGWEDPLRRAEDEARAAGDGLLSAHVLRLRALGLAQRDRDASAACRDELLAVARGLHGPALPHGSLVRLVTVEQPWGALQRTPFGQRPCPFDVDLVFDVSGRLVASWLEIEWAGAARPEDALGFSRSIALLAAGAPALAVQAAASAGGRVAARAVLAMARAEVGDAEAAADGLLAARPRDGVDARLLELASAHVALVGRERDAVDRARAALAAAPPQERPMAVSLVRARLEAVIAVGPGASAFHDARTLGTGPNISAQP